MAIKGYFHSPEFQKWNLTIGYSFVSYQDILISNSSSIIIFKIINFIDIIYCILILVLLLSLLLAKE